MHNPHNLEHDTLVPILQNPLFKHLKSTKLNNLKLGSKFIFQHSIGNAYYVKSHNDTITCYSTKDATEIGSFMVTNKYMPVYEVELKDILAMYISYSRKIDNYEQSKLASLKSWYISDNIINNNNIINNSNSWTYQIKLLFKNLTKLAKIRLSKLTKLINL